MKEVKVYDSFDQNINTLVQWDSDVYIHIKDSEITAAHYVHFFNSKSKEALVMESSYSDGVLTVKVPNDLLEEDYPITGYIYVTSNGENRSIFVFKLFVRNRPIPSDGVHEDSEDYLFATAVLAECKEYAEKSANSASESADSASLSESWAIGGTGVRSDEDTNNSKYYSEQSNDSATAAKTSETNAETSATNASTSESNAKTSETNAKNSENNAEEYAEEAKEYAIGDDESAKSYYELALQLAQSLDGVLRPMGTVTFDELIALKNVSSGDLYNVSDGFETTDAFVEGSGYVVYMGADVFMRTDGLWDVMGGVISEDITKDDVEAIFA